MPRILLLTPSSKPGGAERSFASLAAGLPREGFEPRVVLLERGPLEGWLRAAGCAYEVAGPDAVAALAAGVAAVVSNKSEGHLVGGPAAAAAGVPAVWWQQDIACGIDYELAAAESPAAAIVCSSDYALAAQRTLTPGGRLRKVHLGLDVAAVAARRGSGGASRAALGRDGAPLVGIVGRLERWKGQDVFLRAAARVAAERPDVRFAVVGGTLAGKEEDYPDELRALAAELGIADRVRFAGHADDPYPWLDALDVSVHATEGEPFGLVVVEALALGKPVVATRLGGPAEIVEDGVSGLLVAPGDDGATAEAILRLVGDGELARGLGEAGARRAREFTAERMAAGFAAVLREVLA